ncbi:SNase-domain-containing protein [Piedraia hortae CBS 480.64]|uniref:Probable endonuclease LCL3 n=1 Tax=Piedraia hortae CBS 480.64 TaxID=1314780 RepID=A0A6A7C882_9PEZI|nr:SNase-domain-containing protein [Piedraia hortae CBS 480.64]
MTAKTSDSANCRSWLTPEALVFSAVSTASTIALLRFYKTYLRRIPSTDHLKPDTFRHRSLFGYVTRVGDGDNFHFFHTPGGRWLGWGWLPNRKVGKMKKLRGQTLHVRIAGVDAPEMAHFGRPAQPYGQDALDWLQATLLHRYVRIRPYRRDQYERIVCGVTFWRWGFLRRDLGLAMIRNGLATVYEAKFGSEFGSKEIEYRKAESRARERKVGMWHKPGLVRKILGEKGRELESPREYKTRMAKLDKENAKAGAR